MWQCTSDGTVNGIDGRVDLNFEFQVEGSEGDNDTSTEEQIEGWYEDSDGSKYYYQGGVALTGFKTISGSKYYFNSSGVLQKSKWVTVSGKKYYMKSDGTVTTGYNKIGNYYYLFDSSGVMKTGTVTMSNKKYKLFSSGKACIHTVKTKTSLNYRTGPATSYKTKGTLKKGKVVSIIRTKNGWSQMANGYWVKSSYTTKVTTYPIFISYKAKTTTDVNYRTGPGTSYKKKGTYKKGKVITIKATKNGWGKMSNGYWIKLTYTKKI